MENPNTTLSKSWLLFGASTFGMVFFAGLYFFNPKTAQVFQTVPHNVTNTVVQPADIPEDYVKAMNIYAKITNAPILKDDGVLFNLHDVMVSYTFASPVQEVVSQDEVKAKFELILRRNNVPIKTDSRHFLIVTINGFFDPATKNILCYSIEVTMNEQQYIFRDGECRLGYVTSWLKGGTTATVGRYNANGAILEDVEKAAEIFANDYLSANPKQQTQN